MHCCQILRNIGVQAAGLWGMSGHCGVMQDLVLGHSDFWKTCILPILQNRFLALLAAVELCFWAYVVPPPGNIAIEGARFSAPHQGNLPFSPEHVLLLHQPTTLPHLSICLLLPPTCRFSKTKTGRHVSAVGLNAFTNKKIILNCNGLHNWGSWFGGDSSRIFSPPEWLLELSRQVSVGWSLAWGSSQCCIWETLRLQS